MELFKGRPVKIGVIKRHHTVPKFEPARALTACSSKTQGRTAHFHKADVIVDSVHTPFGRTNRQAQLPLRTRSGFPRSFRAKVGFIMSYLEP